MKNILKIFFILSAFIVCVNQAYAEDETFTVVEEMPEYPGGTEAMMNYIATNLKYPEEAIKNNIEGRVMLRFIIGKDGSISDINVIRGVDPLLDNEAVRVVASMPKWKPGKQRGKPVNVSYVIPVTFRIPPEKSK